MDNMLRNLKSSMKKTVFSGLTFTENHKNQIKNKISKMKSDEEIVLAILQLLTEERTGYELNQKIRARGIQNFENHEGQLYMFLHRLEHKGFVQSFWTENEEKYYSLSNKGCKLIKHADKKSTQTKSILKELLEG